MIDISRERLMRLSEVPDYLARRGVRVSRTSVYNWVAACQLETVDVGSIKYTSEEALQRHAERKRPESQPLSVDGRKRSEAALRALEAAGW